MFSYSLFHVQDSYASLCMFPTATIFAFMAVSEADLNSPGPHKPFNPVKQTTLSTIFIFNDPGSIQRPGQVVKGWENGCGAFTIF